MNGVKKMVLQMLGIDYEKADLDVRSIFSFQKHKASEALVYLKEEYPIKGAVLISTCNRTELYVSSQKGIENLKEIFCSLKNVTEKNYGEYIAQREGEDAVHHLFQLTCGMKSKIFGEDQIITQVKDALSCAREVQTTDAHIERVFMRAITAAKKVKTQVHLTAVKASVIQEMKKVLLNDLGNIKNKKCLVIGNGEIGRLAARNMAEDGALVTVTLRSYKTGQAEIPEGCSVIDYYERYSVIEDFDIIISATTSPHHTIKYEECKDIFKKDRNYIFVDLAVPRDISPEFENEKNIILYNIDSLGGVSESEKDNKAVAEAIEIINEYEEKLRQEESVKEYIGTIQSVSKAGGELSYYRIKKELNKMEKSQTSEKLEELIKYGAEKTISAMLFELQKGLPTEYWQACLQIIKEEMPLKELC